MHQTRTCMAAKEIALAIALFALLLARLVLPPGYMLAANPAGLGLPVVTPCDGQRAVSTAMDGHMGHEPSKQDHEEKGDPQVCAFAAVGQAFTLDPWIPTVGIAEIAPRAAPVMLHAQQPGRGLAAPPPPKTGPPSFA